MMMVYTGFVCTRKHFIQKNTFSLVPNSWMVQIRYYFKTAAKRQTPQILAQIKQMNLFFSLNILWPRSSFTRQTGFLTQQFFFSIQNGMH